LGSDEALQFLTLEATMNTVKKGDRLEKALFDHLKRELEEDRLPIKSSCSQIFWKKPYFSRDRNSNIVFDISIEISIPSAKEFCMLWLVECKNYSTKTVPVDDVEEFFGKVQQVSAANSKAIIASSGAFSSGATNYAKAKGIGLFRYFFGSEPDDINAGKIDWVLYRSAASSLHQYQRHSNQDIFQALTYATPQKSDQSLS
jgi:hypothetical protein